MNSVRVAAVQAAPAYLDREATVEKACRLIEEAAAQGARLIVFPELFIPGYPDWVWRTTPWDDESWFERLHAQAVTVPSAATQRLGQASRAARAWVLMGVDERDAHGNTIYNTLLYFNPDGELVNLHRKLMPTGGERLVFGMGDGSTLRAVDTDFGRLGGLLCWENYMPLTRMAMYAQGVDVYAAPTWDCSEVWVPTLQHIAKEGRMHVIGAAPCMRGTDVPEQMRGSLYGGADDWLCRGRSVIIGPEGEILAGPLVDEVGTLYADLDLARARASRRQFDPVGHYARPDVFRLEVDTAARTPVAFMVTGDLTPAAVPGVGDGSPAARTRPRRAAAAAATARRR